MNEEKKNNKNRTKYSTRIKEEKKMGKDFSERMIKEKQKESIENDIRIHFSLYHYICVVVLLFSLFKKKILIHTHTNICIYEAY